AVETYVTTRRNGFSDMFSREAWRLLDANYERTLVSPDAVDARAAMQLGAFYAGMAIELSMLGATHACANPLTARYGTTHGVAIAVMLPHVVRWNAEVVGDRYEGLLPGEELAVRLEQLARAAGLSRTLKDIGASEADIP